MDKNNEHYFLLASRSSRNGGGLKPYITTTGDYDIIRSAYEELASQGGSFEDMAGIEMIDVYGDETEFRPERELTHEELLELAVEKRGDDGRLYEIYPMTKAGARDFIESAEYYGLKKKAIEYIEKWCPELMPDDVGLED